MNIIIVFRSMFWTTDRGFKANPGGDNFDKETQINPRITTMIEAILEARPHFCKAKWQQYLGVS